MSGRVSDAQAAKNLVQEIFLRAMRQESGLCGIDNPRAWLFQVARNLLIDRYRLGKDEIPLDEAQQPVDELSNCLPRVLSELSPDDREAVMRRIVLVGRLRSRYSGNKLSKRSSRTRPASSGS